MLNEPIFPSYIFEPHKRNLRNNSPQLPARRRDTMGGAPVSSGEYFAGYQKCGRIRAEIREEIGQTIEKNEGFGGIDVGDQLVICKSYT